MRASRGLKWENKIYKLKRSIVFPLMQLIVNTYANSIIESSLYVCVIVSTVDVNDCIFCVNEQQKV